MHHTARRAVFYSLVAVFVAGGCYALLAAFGLTFDPSEFRFVRTGSLFISATPRDAALFIEGAPVEKRPGIISGGILVKNLPPGAYMIRLSREGKISWDATLPIMSGLVTRATGVFLWPHEASSTVVGKNIAAFSLSAGSPVTEVVGKGLFVNGAPTAGEKLEYASDDTAVIITRSGNTVYLVTPGEKGAVTNLTRLFHSLKERDLGLPGTVPLVEVRPHPFSAGKFIVVTKTSLYLLDVRRVSLERLATVDEITAFTFDDDDAFLARADNALTVVSFLFKTATEALFSSSTVTAIAVARDGDIVVGLTAEGELFAYYRITGERVTIASGVSEYTVAPDGVRLAFVAERRVQVTFLDEYAGDTFVPRGLFLAVGAHKHTPHGLSWSTALPRYLFFLTGNVLSAAEIGLHGERSTRVLAENVNRFMLSSRTAYLLKEDGSLVRLSFEE